MWGSFLRPVFKPIVRLLVGFIAIPIFRLCLRKIGRVQQLNAEMEKDLEQWFRGALLLLVATKNMEDTILEALSGLLGHAESPSSSYWIVAMRLMLAIGVTEAMPDQELFAVIHPGPARLKFPKGQWLRSLREQLWPFCQGLFCRHLDRSSQVFAIMAVLIDGTPGWICYGLAITQYLIIGLVTSRDKAMDVLSEFDKQFDRRRHWLTDQLQLSPTAEDDWIPVENPHDSTRSASTTGPAPPQSASPPPAETDGSRPEKPAKIAD